jgi:hypothetical protein
MTNTTQACPPADELMDIGNLWLEPLHTPMPPSQLLPKADVSSSNMSTTTTTTPSSRVYPIGMPPSAYLLHAQALGGAEQVEKQTFETFDLNINESDGMLPLSLSLFLSLSRSLSVCLSVCLSVSPAYTHTQLVEIGRRGAISANEKRQ